MWVEITAINDRCHEKTNILAFSISFINLQLVYFLNTLIIAEKVGVNCEFLYW